MSTATAALICIALFAGMLVLMLAGMEIGLRFKREPQAARMIDTAVFALLGLLLGFAFSGAIARLDARRDLIVREVVAIASAYQRIDLLPEARQEGLRDLFRAYLEERIRAVDLIEAGQDPTPAREAAFTLRRKIWDEGIAAQRERDTTTTLSALAAFQEMSRVAAERADAARNYTPGLILGLLVGVALLSALVAGYAIAKPGWRTVMHSMALAGAVSVTLFVILDLDNPRVGVTRLRDADELLRDMREHL